MPVSNTSLPDAAAKTSASPAREQGANGANSAPAGNRVLSLTIGPITCQGCVDTAVGALVKLPGVAGVRVEADGAAEVRWTGEADEHDAFLEKAVAALAAAGKTAALAARA